LFCVCFATPQIRRSPSTVKVLKLAHRVNYDEYFIGFRDRSAIGQVAERAGIPGDNQALIAHVIILDGQIVGGWRRTLKKDKVIVETSLITKLTKPEIQAVAAATERFGKHLGLPVSIIYKEHGHEQRKTRSL
jgi:winged helix DNA-binding protein